jgi:hypothetical protein
VLTKDDICTLVDIVIFDPTRTDLLFQSCTTQGFVASDVAQTKKQNYHDQHLANQLFPLAIEIFGCLHKHVDVFLHNCTNTIWSFKGPESLLLSILITFLQQKNSITLQRLQASFILS